MEIIAVISLGIVLGTFFSLDMYFSTKRQGAFTRQFLTIITISIPAIYQAIYQTAEFTQSSFGDLWFKFFYLSYALTLFLACTLTIFFIYKPLVKEVNLPHTRTFTFFDFLFKGYLPFKEEIDLAKKSIVESNNNNSKLLPNIQKEIREDLLEYITEIYSTIEESDMEGFLGYVLYTFVERFMSSTDARFTIRSLDFQNNQMVTILTTRTDAVPGAIPLKNKNLVVESMKCGRPLIYSENKNFHFTTKNNSIKKGVYQDYVSYCLLQTSDGKPYYSLCLDVKGETAIQRMKAVVDSLIFDVICNAITLKIVKEIEKQQNEQK